MAKFDDKPKKKKRKKKIKKDAGGNVVDASTGLTITPDETPSKEPLNENAQKLKDYNERQEKKKKENKVDVTISNRIGQSPRAKVKIGGKTDDQLYEEMGESEEKKEEFWKEGGVYDRYNRIKDIAEGGSSVGKYYENQDKPKASIVDPNAEAKEVLGEDATEEDIADYNSSKKKEALPSQENQELGDELSEGLSIKKALENEVTQKATTKEELLQGRMIANEVAEETRREKRRREKEEKKEEKVKSPLILKILEKAPRIAKDMLVDLSMKDIFKVASQLGISDPKSKKERKNAEAYLDTVQKLGVQDYFPQVGENIAVGTFTGSRIGSQTIYSGAGELAPMSLYDAKRRAMKAGLKSSTKSVENFMKFMELPPVYNEDYINIATEAYKDIMSDSDLSSEERRVKLNKLSNSGAQLMGAWNTVQNLQSRLLNTKNEEKESLYMPPAMKKKMYSIIENSMDPEYLKRAITGDVNLAKDAAELSLFSDMIYVAKESAKDFTGFEKTEGAEQFIDELTAAEKLELQQWQPGSGGTLATKPLVKKYVKFFTNDIDGVFDAIFKDEDGNIRDNFSEDQEEQAKKMFTEMLAPSFLEDMKTMSTGFTQSSGTQAKKQEREYFFSNVRQPADLKTFKETGAASNTKSEWVNNLSGHGSTIRENSNSFPALGGGVLAIEKPTPNMEFYIPDSKISGGDAAGIRIRAKVGGGATRLLTASDIKGFIEDGETVTAADLGGNILTIDHMDRFIESSGGGAEGSTSAARYRLQAQSEAPYFVEDHVRHGIESDSDVARYNASDEQGMMWLDIAQPDYVYTSGGTEEQLSFPFFVQGVPYYATQEEMKSRDRELRDSQSAQAQYQNP